MREGNPPAERPPSARRRRRFDPAAAGQAAQSRGETVDQVLDRNVAELLQELRVACTGVQILFACLLSLAFTQRFEELGGFDLAVYTPWRCSLQPWRRWCSSHRCLFHRIDLPRKRKAALVVVADRFARHEAESLGCRSRPVITSG